ncbi:hypothetical protein C8R46DRAFT_1220000 [Mycena filopes]|nr:hypothetical protein C8R46DRAFT_1220000 [Mycena filopes]
MAGLSLVTVTASPSTTMHPSLQLSNLWKLPLTLRTRATTAAHGSLEALLALLSDLPQLSRMYLHFLLPVFYAIRDPAEIPTILDRLLSSTSEAEFGTIRHQAARVLAGLRGLATVGLARSILTEAFSELWFRCWQWIDFLHIHEDHLPAADIFSKSATKKRGAWRQISYSPHRPNTALVFLTSMITRIAVGHEIVSHDNPYVPLTKAVYQAVSCTVRHFPSWPFQVCFYAGVARAWPPVVRKLYEYPVESVERELRAGEASPSFLLSWIENPESSLRREDVQGLVATMFTAGEATSWSAVTLFILATPDPCLLLLTLTSAFQNVTWELENGLLGPIISPGTTTPAPLSAAASLEQYRATYPPYS